jgi:hypothetical protein
VLTFHNDNLRSGANIQETVLTPANVNPGQFGRLFSYAVDGYVYAQPLYKADLTIGGSRHNVVFVATEHDSVYAFDAVNNDPTRGGGQLWRHSFLDPVGGITSVPQPDIGSTDIVPEVGITGTPVIDAATNTMYVVPKTKELRMENGQMVAHYVHRLHALDITTGADLGSKVIGDTIIGGPEGGHTNNTPLVVPGTGDGSFVDPGDGISKVRFNSRRGLQRPGLVLDPSHGVVYVGFASHGDIGPYHGWIIGYDAHLSLKTFFNTSPDGGLAGTWQSGGAPALDSAGNLFVSTGNGSFSVLPAGARALGDWGGALGYGENGAAQGAIRGSVAIVFRNNPASRTGLATNGHFGQEDNLPDTINFNMAAHETPAHTFRVTLTYRNGTLVETITDLTAPEHPTFDKAYAVDVPALVHGNTAYVGFTGGTSGQNAQQDIRTWQFEANGRTVINHSSGFADPSDVQANGLASFPEGNPVGTAFRSHQDIGIRTDPLSPGNASFDNGTYTLTAGGSDIFGSEDHMQYSFRPLSGDGEIVARVASLTNTDFWTKAGVMIREDLTPGSRNVFMVMSPHKESEITWRDNPGGGTGAIEGHTIYPDGSGPIPGWIRLVRHGDSFTGSWSEDGVNWNPAGPPHTTTMVANVYVGLALTAHNDRRAAVATFDHVSVTGKMSDPGEAVARLTAAANNQVGTFFSKEKVDITNFSTTFTFQMRAASADPIADGMTFTIQSGEGGTDYGESVLRLTPTTAGLRVQDYFTPWEWRELNRVDQDLGSGSTMLLPDQPGRTPHLAVETGKSGRIYLINRDDMGRVSLDPFAESAALQQRGGSIVDTGNPQVWGSPAFWNNLVYYHGSNDVARAFQLSLDEEGRSVLRQVSQSPDSTRFPFPGGQPSVSANGFSDGVVWSVDSHLRGERSDLGPAALYAFKATDLSQVLYNSNATGDRDRAGNAVKFVVPTISNGHVYVGTQYQLDVFGLFPDDELPPGAAPSGVTAQPLSDTQIELSWRNEATNATEVRVERSTVGPSGPWTEIAILPRDRTGFTDTGLTASTRYFYQLRATNRHGSSAYSEPVSARTRIAKTALTVVDVSASAISLSWTPVADDHYDVERSTDGMNFVTINPDPIPPSQTTFTDTGLEQRTYFYRVRAFNSDADTSLSDASRATIGPLSIDHSRGFANPPKGPGSDDLQANGSAQFAETAGLVSAVDQRASFYARERVGIRTFTTTFEFKISEGSAERGEGLTFVIQADPNGTRALGPRGGGLGYGPDRPSPARGILNSVAIKFDIFSNAGEGNNSTGIFSGGRSPTIRDPALPPDPAPNLPDRSVDLRDTDIELNNQHVKRVRLTYDGSMLVETITEPDTQASFTVRYEVNIPGIVGNDTAFVGFTGATSASRWALIGIQTWTYDEGDESGLVPRRPRELLPARAEGLDVHLDWRTGNAYTAEGFIIERSTARSGPFEEIRRIMDPNRNNFTDTVAEPGVYFYQVRFFNALGSSAPSNVVRVIVRGDTSSPGTNDPNRLAATRSGAPSVGSPLANIQRQAVDQLFASDDFLAKEVPS